MPSRSTHSMHALSTLSNLGRPNAMQLKRRQAQENRRGQVSKRRKDEGCKPSQDQSSKPKASLTHTPIPPRLFFSQPRQISNPRSHSFPLPSKNLPFRHRRRRDRKSFSLVSGDPSSQDQKGPMFGAKHSTHEQPQNAGRDAGRKGRGGEGKKKKRGYGGKKVTAATAKGTINWGGGPPACTSGPGRGNEGGLEKKFGNEGEG
ncbi:hypothetical protein BS50DRAFT_205343 [Corynespora cassiicola Philippines]|uniref:Uncharacterized protein n=1 Tax=Corynespora cassiicola Philippines TaxID=1448308 RepID=A0A2T2N5E4_CORCC|nr:hypothetical protein BS50DRAFT_205343 [Corynespora cassiicola Philippines]